MQVKRRDAAYRRTRGNSRRVLFVQYTNPGTYPPLLNAMHILAEDGWMVRVLGMAMPGLEPLIVPDHPNIDVRVMGAIQAGPVAKLQYVLYCFWSLVHLLIWSPEWIYVSDIFGTPVGLVASYNRSIEVIYHEHDSPPTIRQSSYERACSSIRSRLAMRASAIIIPSAGRAAAFGAEVFRTRPMFVVWNCTRRREATLSAHPPEPPIRFLYHGSIVPQRLPLTVFDALAHLNHDWSLVIVGYETMGAKGYTERIRSHATTLGILGRLQFIGAVSREDLLEIARQCHVGLALVDSSGGDANFASMATASCKAFDYLASGLPIVIPDSPEWQQLFGEPGFGLACDPNSPDSIREVLDWFATHSSERAARGVDAASKIIQDWNYERQFAPVVNFMGSSTVRRIGHLADGI